MDIKIYQKQSRRLLEEHAKSSFDFGFVGRNELYFAITFFLIGTLMLITLESTRLAGLPFILIGVFEIIKYPTRESRWVRKKEKEQVFNKNIEFQIGTDFLKVTYDQESKTHKYKSMRECLISKTGIVFKITISEYFYISFNSLDDESQKQGLIAHLTEKFENGKIKVKGIPA